jgi:uncharacterized protein
VNVALIVIAKAPVPGRVKTRLSPPCSEAQAASLAAAALRDTLKAVARTRAHKRVLAFDECGIADAAARWRPPGFSLIRQRGDGLGQRLAAAFADVGGPALLVGMDTPQLTPALLADGLRALAAPGGAEAVLGPSLDGGYWSIGLREPNPEVFESVPMSSDQTLIAQRERLAQLHLSVHEQPPLLDVDTFDDARSVASLAPHSAFAATLALVERELGNVTPVAA